MLFVTADPTVPVKGTGTVGSFLNSKDCWRKSRKQLLEHAVYNNLHVEWLVQ